MVILQKNWQKNNWEKPTNTLISLLEVGLATLWIRLHGLLPRSPISRAHFPKLIRILERLHQSESLVHRPPHRQIVNRNLPQNPLGINNKQPPESHPGILIQNPIVPRNLEILISQQRDIHLPQAPLLPGGVHPRQVREVAVRGGGDHRRLDPLELVDAVREGDDFRGAHEGAETGGDYRGFRRGGYLQVQGVEEDHHVLALVVREADFFELALDDGGALEIRRWFLKAGDRHCGIC